MEVFTLNANFQPAEVFDDFKTAIWTDRYAAHGDVTLLLKDTLKARTFLTEGTFLSIVGAKEPMMIETRLFEKGTIKITGPSMSGFLKQRPFRNSSTTNKKTFLEMTGAPGAIATALVDEMLSPGGLLGGGLWFNSSYETFSNFLMGSSAAGTSATVSIKYGDLYSAVKEVCDPYDLGFTLYPGLITDSSHKIYFSTYAGVDKTSTVRFQSALDSLQNVKDLRSIAGFKTDVLAWPTQVSGAMGEAHLYKGGVAYRNWERRTLILEVSDIGPDDVNVGGVQDNALLKRLLDGRARNALINNNYIKMVDGELVPQSPFKYGVDYGLGDIVELVGGEGVATSARITEYIRAEDAAGYKEYPTLSIL